MEKTFLSILACPNCKGSLSYQKDDQELVCPVCRLAYPIRDDIPVMLIEEARTLDSNED
jgi:uncharacterized protein YbaR (Trm112 family)